MDNLSIPKMFWVKLKNLSISKNLRTLKTNFESADGLEKNYLLNGLAKKWSKYVHRLFLNIIFCKNFEQDFLVSRAKSKWYNNM